MITESTENAGQDQHGGTETRLAGPRFARGTGWCPRVRQAHAGQPLRAETFSVRLRVSVVSVL